MNTFRGTHTYKLLFTYIYIHILQYVPTLENKGNSHFFHFVPKRKVAKDKCELFLCHTNVHINKHIRYKNIWKYTYIDLCTHKYIREQL